MAIMSPGTAAGASTGPMGTIGHALRSVFNPNAKRGANEYSDVLASFVDGEFRRRQQERQPWELQWRLNVEFFNDNQYLEMHAAAALIQEVPKVWWWQEREVFNHIAPIIETRVARLARIQPKVTVRPASGDLDDIAAADVDQKILEYGYHEDRLDQRMETFIGWLEVQGTCFLKTVWDPRAGRMLLSAHTGDGPTLDSQGNEPTDGEPDDVRELARLFNGGGQTLQLFEGDCATHVVPPVEMFPDSPWRDDLSQCQSLIHAKAFPVEFIYDQFGVWVQPEPVAALQTLAVTAGTGGLGYGSGGFRTVSRPMRNHAVVKEWWERPTRQYPQGRYIVVAGKKTIYAGPLPFNLGSDGRPDIPFSRSVSVRRPGCIWGKSVIERLIPVQRRYNALRNRVAEYLNRVSIGGWYKPEGIDDQDLDNAPGMIVPELANGQKPSPIQWPPLPNEFQVEFENLMRELTILSGVSELARFSEGQSGVRAGVSLAIALEQDDTRLSTTARSITSAIATMGKQRLRLYKQFVQEPRVLKIVGSDNLPELKSWTAKDIRSDDVVVEGAPGLMDSPAQRKEVVTELLRAGLYTDPDTGKLTKEGRAKVFEMLEMGDWESAADDVYAQQRARALRENQLLMQGQALPIRDYDDDMTHIQMHRKQQLSFDYDRAISGPGGQVIDLNTTAHINMHLQRLQAQAGQVQAQESQAAQQANAVAQAELQQSRIRAAAQTAAVPLRMPPGPNLGGEPLTAQEMAQRGMGSGETVGINTLGPALVEPPAGP